MAGKGADGLPLIKKMGGRVARQITDVYQSDAMPSFNVDYEQQGYRVSWIGDWRSPPDLSQFPDIDGFIREIHHSAEVDALWKTSKVVAHGADSAIRLLEYATQSFPMCKVAINHRQRLLVRDESYLLTQLSNVAQLPVVKVHEVPFEDSQGIFGYRMEGLRSIPAGEGQASISDISKAIQLLHDGGVVHGDLSPSNVMLSHDGCLKLIDFGRAGFIDTGVPASKRRPGTRDMVYKAEMAFVALRALQGMYA